MRTRMTLAIVSFTIVAVAVIAFLLHGYIFSIYEVTLADVPKEVKMGDTVEIAVVPINGLGFRPPLRKAPFKLEFRSGAGLIEPSGGSISEGPVKLKCVKPGKVELLVVPEHALKPTIIEFEIK